MWIADIQKMFFLRMTELDVFVGPGYCLSAALSGMCSDKWMTLLFTLLKETDANEGRE